MALHKFIRKGSLEPRLYQETILGTAVNKNTLVVIPTGLGKTFIAAMLAAKKLDENEDLKIMFLAPTKPLVEQHCETWKKVLKFDRSLFNVFTGLISPKKRKELYKDSKFIFATPQVIQNDVVSRLVDLSSISLLIFDEAHRAVGDYAYPFIAKSYVENSKGRILALTASPGSEKEKVSEVCKNLYIEEIESRDRKDEDVKPYVKDREFNWVRVSLPEDFKKIRSMLEDILRDYLKILKQSGVLASADISKIWKRDLLQLQGKLAVRAANEINLYPLISKAAGALKVYHAIELIETQGIAPLHEYFKKFRKDRSKAAGVILADPRFKKAETLIEIIEERGDEHPKVDKLLSLLDPKKKAIVFANYRNSVDLILKTLSKKNIPVTKLVGQSARTSGGLTQKQQIAKLDEFRKMDTGVLVTTSVGEEGLDIPSVDHVIFYEPVPSAIRSIQRQGRTARHRTGKISILVTKGTRDEAYYWSARSKEKKMQKIMQNIGVEKSSQSTLDGYEPAKNSDGKVVIFADTRESSSGVLMELSSMKTEVRIKQLSVADFQLSDRVGVERKKAEDFVQSLIDGRLFNQIPILAEVFDRPLLIVEGNDIFGLRNVHPNAIRGGLASIAVDFGVPIIFTKDIKDTAALLFRIAKREQLDLKREIRLRNAVRPKTLGEQQQFIVESLPTVGPSLAKRLLAKFGSVENIINASENDLKKIDKIGEKKAKEIRRVLNSVYEKD